MFAFAAVLGKIGANDWIADQLADLFELVGNDRKELRSNLYELFPANTKSQPTIIRDYFSLIVALNETVKNSAEARKIRDFQHGRLSLAYTDFIRGIIQLNQYEEQIDIPNEAKTPRKVLEKQVKDVLAGYLQKMELSRKQSFGIQYLNAKSWLKSKISGEQYEPINLRMTREELDKFTIMKIQKNPISPVSGAAAPQIHTGVKTNDVIGGEGRVQTLIRKCSRAVLRKNDRR